MQDIVQSSNQNDYQKCGTQFYKNPVSRFGNYLNQLNIFFHSNNWIKLIIDYLKTGLKLLKKHNLKKFPYKIQKYQNY